jgi:ABC-type nickel/cobalt efflux system permease component RcnA
LFGVDELIAGLANGGPTVVLGVALLLGVRHATDPDHLVAVSTLMATEDERRARRATVLGLSWGLGHAATLILCGLPIVLFNGYLPDWAQQAAEALIGLVIVLLGVRLLAKWRRGRFHAHPHAHGAVVHRHLHAHASESHAHEHVSLRSPTQAFGIGCLHGVGGSAAVGVLLLASIPSGTEAAAALVLFALATAFSMAAVSSGIGYALASPLVGRRFVRLVPVFGAATLFFGAWYATAAVI